MRFEKLRLRAHEARAGIVDCLIEFGHHTGDHGRVDLFGLQLPRGEELR